MISARKAKHLEATTMFTVFSLVYPEEGSIAETSVKILIITASVLQFLNLHGYILSCKHSSRPIRARVLSLQAQSEAVGEGSSFSIATITDKSFCTFVLTCAFMNNFLK